MRSEDYVSTAMGDSHLLLRLYSRRFLAGVGQSSVMIQSWPVYPTVVSTSPGVPGKIARVRV